VESSEGCRLQETLLSIIILVISINSRNIGRRFSLIPKSPKKCLPCTPCGSAETHDSLIATLKTRKPSTNCETVPISRSYIAEAQILLATTAQEDRGSRKNLPVQFGRYSGERHRDQEGQNDETIEKLDILLVHPNGQNLTGVDLYGELDPCDWVILIRVRPDKPAIWSADP
jgi:hypothetical protein